jgi:hypothetical protein
MIVERVSLSMLSIFRINSNAGDWQRSLGTRNLAK